MLTNIDVAEIRTWAREGQWYVSPDGDYIMIGDDVQIGDGAKIGDRARIGHGAHIGVRARIGHGAHIGDRVVIGDGAHIGVRARIGHGAHIGVRARIGHGAQIGDGANIGYGAKIGDGVVIGYGANIGDRARINEQVFLPIYRAARYQIHWHSVGHIRSGCIIRPIYWWRDNVVRCAEEHGYSEQQQQLYACFVEQIIAWEKVMLDAGLIGTITANAALPQE